jgi:hypothetical protein
VQKQRRCMSLHSSSFSQLTLSTRKHILTPKRSLKTLQRTRIFNSFKSSGSANDARTPVLESTATRTLTPMLIFPSTMNGLIVGLPQWCVTSLSYLGLLTFSRLQLKGEESATLTKPPNHKLFDMKRPSLSPVLQRRLDAQNQKNTPVAPPVFNFNIGNEVATLFHPFAPTAPAVAPIPTAPMHATAPALAPTTTTADCPFLLSPLRCAGPEFSLDEFCTVYELGDAVLKRFEENCYKKSSTLRFVTIQELKDMGFRLGEIAALRVAVEAWSISPT